MGMYCAVHSLRSSPRCCPCARASFHPPSLRHQSSVTLSGHQPTIAHLRGRGAFVDEIPDEDEGVGAGAEFALRQQLAQLLETAVHVADDDDAARAELLGGEGGVDDGRQRVACHSNSGPVKKAGSPR